MFKKIVLVSFKVVKMKVTRPYLCRPITEPQRFVQVTKRQGHPSCQCSKVVSNVWTKLSVLLILKLQLNTQVQVRSNANIQKNIQINPITLINRTQKDSVCKQVNTKVTTRDIKLTWYT